MERNRYLASESVINGNVSTYNKSLTISDSLYSTGSNIAEIPESGIKHPSGSTLTYWYNLYEYSSLFVTSKDVYAYRIVSTVTNVSVSSRDLQNLDLVYGGAEDFGLVDNMNVGLSLLSNGSLDFWYVNDYAVQPFYYAALALYGGTNATPAAIDYSGNLIFSVVPYTMDSMLDEIYAELLNLVDGQGDIYDELVKIYDSSASIDDKLYTIRGQLENIRTALPVLHNDLVNIENVLKSIQESLDKMYEEQQEQTTWLEKIWQSLQDLFSGNYGGSSVPENPEGSVGFDTEIPGSDSSGSGSGSSSGSQDDEKVGFFDMVANFFSNFFGNLMNAVKGLFVPDEEYLGDFFTRLNDFFSEKLGFLYVPIDLLIQLLNALLSAEPGTASLPLPEFSWEGQVVLSAQNVNLDLSKDFPQLQSMLHFATNVMLIGAVLNLLQNKLKEMLQ